MRSCRIARSMASSIGVNWWRGTSNIEVSFLLRGVGIAGDMIGPVRPDKRMAWLPGETDLLATGKEVG